MYSVVIMMALSGNAEAPNFGGGCRGGGCKGRAVASCCGTKAVVVASCSGSRGHGCRGRGHGCTGRGHGCRGRSGCNGGGLFGGLFKGRGCHGCKGGYVGCAGSSGCSGTVIEKKKEEKKDKKTSAEGTATVAVNLPADAKLTIDGTPTTSTSSLRTFVTPTLSAGQVYFYILKATVVRDGRPIVAEQRIRVQAGERTPVSFDFSSTGVALNK